MKRAQFMDIGVQRQYDAASTPEANHQYNNSCKACASKGYCDDCEHCPIRGAHRFMLETFAIRQDVEREMANRKLKLAAVGA